MMGDRTMVVTDPIDLTEIGVGRGFRNDNVDELIVSLHLTAGADELAVVVPPNAIRTLANQLHAAADAVYGPQAKPSDSAVERAVGTTAFPADSNEGAIVIVGYRLTVDGDDVAIALAPDQAEVFADQLTQAAHEATNL